VDEGGVAPPILSNGTLRTESNWESHRLEARRGEKGSSMRRWVVMSAVAATLVIGCKPESSPLKPGQTHTVRGELVTGVECPMIVTQDGHRYSLIGELGRFKIGDRVCLKGTIPQASYCMQGEATLEVEAIGAEDACP